jgi:hypothetical protein
MWFITNDGTALRTDEMRPTGRLAAFGDISSRLNFFVVSHVTNQASGAAGIIASRAPRSTSFWKGSLKGRCVAT